MMASGKSTVGQLLAAQGAVVIEADRLVHHLQQPGTAETLAIADLLGVHVLNDDGGLDRDVLKRHIARDPQVLRLLEEILVPGVIGLLYQHLQQAAQAQAKVAVLDVPLLFEHNLHHRCDATVWCDAGADAATRAQARPGVTAAVYQQLAGRRLNPTDAARLATHTLPTRTGGLEKTKAMVAHLYQHIVTLPGQAWPGAWADVASSNGI